jgi:hypothetical protein
MRALAKFSAILLLAYTAGAAQLRQPVMAGSKYSYADLLRKVFPNLKVDKAAPETATASKSVTIRHLTGDAEPFEVADTAKITDVKRVDMRIPGKPQLLLMYAVDQNDGTRGASELALFDMSNASKLLDVAEGPETPPDDHGWVDSEILLLHLNDTTDVFVFVTEHHNSTEGFDSFTPIFVHNGRLKKIDTFDLLSYNDSAIGPWVERIAFSTAPEPGRSLGIVTVRVTLELKPMHVSATEPNRPCAHIAQYAWGEGIPDRVDTTREIDQIQQPL